MYQFGVVTDLQYADIPQSGVRNYRATIDKFLQVAGQFKEKKLPLILQFGDVIDRDWSSMTKMHELFKVSGLPIRSVLGNHDFNVPVEHKRDVMRMLNVPSPGYYTFDLNDTEDPANRWRIVAMHGYELSLGTADTDAKRKAAEKLREKYRLASGKLPESWNGCASPEQLKWLEQELTRAENDAVNVIVCSHFPIFAQGESVAKKRGLSFGGLLNSLPIYYHLMGVSVWNGKEILDILDRFNCVKAYFAGHLHEGSYGVRKKVHHVTFRGMVDASPLAAAVVTLDKKHISISGWGTEVSRELAIK